MTPNTSNNIPLRPSYGSSKRDNLLIAKKEINATILRMIALHLASVKRRNVRTPEHTLRCTQQRFQLATGLTFRDGRHQHWQTRLCSSQCAKPHWTNGPCEQIAAHFDEQWNFDGRQFVNGWEVSPWRDRELFAVGDHPNITPDIWHDCHTTPRTRSCNRRFMECNTETCFELLDRHAITPGTAIGDSCDTVSQR